MADLFNLDFEAAKTSFKAFISTHDNFKDYNFEGSTADDLLNQFAYFIQTFSFYLNNVGNEFFVSSAQNEDNIYKIASQLNYLPSRKVSPTITISLTRIGSDNIFIPAFSSWSMGSLKLTNLTDISITDSSTHQFTLSEGTMIIESFISDGSDWQTFSLAERTKVADDNLFVYVDTPDGAGGFTLGTENWLPIILSDLNTSGNNYYINYFETFDIRFDNGRVFTKPAEDDRIRIIYLKTEGATNNGSTGAVTLDDTVVNAKLTVTNPNSNVLINGLDEESLIGIQQRAPHAYATQGRNVTQKDYDSHMESYGSYALFADHRIWGGHLEWIDDADGNVVREENGTELDMGHIYWTALKATTYDYLTQTEINAVETHLDKRKFLAMFLRFLHPNIIEITPTISVKYYSTILPSFDTTLIADVNTYLNALEGFSSKFNKSNLDQFVDSQTNVEYMSSSITSNVQVKSGPELNSIASSGTTDTLVDSSLVGTYSDDHFEGYHIHHLTGANAPQTIVCGEYTDSSGTFTFAKKITLADGTTFDIGENIVGDDDSGNDGIGLIVSKTGINDIYVKVISGTFVAGNGVQTGTVYVGSSPGEDITTISSIETYLAPASTDTYEVMNFSDYNAIRFNQAITAGSINETISIPSASTTYTATGGTTSTLIDTDNLQGKFRDDHWNAYTLEHLTGTNAPQSLTVTDYDDTTGTIAFATASAINATDTYRLVGTLADSSSVLQMNGVDIGIVDYANGWVTYTYNFALDTVTFDFTYDNVLAIELDLETFMKFTDITSIATL